MTDNAGARHRTESIRRRAYEHWEREGRPEGRGVDHWLRAERELDRDNRGAGQGANANQGEGNKTAALAFDRSQTQFAREADIATYSKAAREALAETEGGALREAEREARAHSHGEDPKLYEKATRLKSL